MRNYATPQIYLYDFRNAFVSITVSAATATIVYSVLFGSIL